MPLNTLQRREQETITIIKALRSKGFTEGVYDKPWRVFVAGDHTARINIKDGVAKLNEQAFTGHQYATIVPHIEQLTTAQTA